MPLFKVDKGTTIKLESALKKEKDIQNLVEHNLEQVLGIYFLATEYPTTFGGRMDTLGIDKNGSPVIIEYKKGSNDNVINQALSYLKWLLDHKAEFEKVLDQSKLPIKSSDIDWTTPRVICLAESYNKFDLDTVDILPINIELLKYRLYQDGLLYIDTENYQKVNISTSGIFKKAAAGKGQSAGKLQKNYTIEELFQGKEVSGKLFNGFRERILELDKDITENATKLYVAYKLGNNFCEIVPQAKGLRVHLDIPYEKVQQNGLKIDDISTKGHWATGNTRFYLANESEIDSAIELVKQSYNFSL